jgi:hypothetical protein
LVSDKDIYISANIVIEQHGDDAFDHAVMQAAYHTKIGDMGGKDAWGRILYAIVELQNIEHGVVN